MNRASKWSWLVLVLAISPRLVMAAEPASIADLISSQPLAGPNSAWPQRASRNRTVYERHGNSFGDRSKLPISGPQLV